MRGKATPFGGKLILLDRCAYTRGAGRGDDCSVQTNSDERDVETSLTLEWSLSIASIDIGSTVWIRRQSRELVSDPNAIHFRENSAGRSHEEGDIFVGAMIALSEK